MNKRVFGLSACAAWALVAVAYATPADALALAAYTGPYATCGSSWWTESGEFCWNPDGYYGFSSLYVQQIRLVTTACNQGGGCSQEQSVYVTHVYSAGRKVTSHYGYCDSYWNLYELGACAC